MDRHFADIQTSQTQEAHYFEQLHLDLDWATGSSATFTERDGVGPLTALEQGFRSIAGRRWHRFKEAEEARDEKRASEMEAFARFWYRVADEVRQHNPHDDRAA